MSRPSITTLVRSPMARCLATMARRTPGITAIFDAPFDTSGVRMASVTSSPFRLDAAGRQFDLRGDGQLLHAVHVVEADALPQRPQGHRAVHGAGIDVGEAQPPARRFAMVLLPAPAGPSIATTTRFGLESAKK